MVRDCNPIPINILIVDDSKEMRKAIRALLNLEPDFRVIGEANNGQEGIEMALNLHPDVIIMDHAMPVMTGIEAAEYLNQHAPTIPVIMFTASNDTENRHLANLASVYSYFVKPIHDVDELCHTIRMAYRYAQHAMV